jgi:hypothetical protein
MSRVQGVGPASIRVVAATAPIGFRQRPIAVPVDTFDQIGLSPTDQLS